MLVPPEGVCEGDVSGESGVWMVPSVGDGLTVDPHTSRHASFRHLRQPSGTLDFAQHRATCARRQSVLSPIRLRGFSWFVRTMLHGMARGSWREGGEGKAVV